MYEYQVVNAQRADSQFLTRYLDAMGEQGYRLVGVIPPDSPRMGFWTDAVTLILEREKKSRSPTR